MEYKTISQNSGFLTCSIKTVFKNVLIGYGISLILFFIFAFVITYTSVPYSIVSPISVIITTIGIITAGILGGKKSSEKGWLTGCITGFIYMLILYIFGSIVYKNPGISSNGIMMIIIGIISGALGSIIGINNKRKFKR